jgi:DNA-directed RNA polymerase omega subunit
MFKLPEELQNKYAFVTLAAKRAEQLQAGALPRVESVSRKMTVIAQQEVAEGAVVALNPEAPAADLETEEE